MDKSKEQEANPVAKNVSVHNLFLTSRLSTRPNKLRFKQWTRDPTVNKQEEKVL
jgi:hypothetical protein